jgi:hypothetical protein
LSEFSNYPNKIDTTAQLPKATDNVTPVKAELFNRLRDAVVCIESELGIQPSSTFSTVKARLDAMEALISESTSSGDSGNSSGTFTVKEDGTILDSAVNIIDILSPLVASNPTSGTIELSVTLPNVAAKANGVSIDTNIDIIDILSPLVISNPTPGTVQLTVTLPTITVKADGVSVDTNINTIDVLSPLVISHPSSGAVQLSVTLPTVKNAGSVITTNTNIFDFQNSFNVTNPGTGIVSISIDIAKIRVYRSTTILAGAAVNVSKTVTWNSISSLITSTNASLVNSNTQISPSKNGTYDVGGQLTIDPTAGVINGITINIVKNGATTVHTISDYGAVWGLGIQRSFSFSFKIELSASDTLEVNWSHSGNTGSTTRLDFGDNFSWFSMIKIQ